MWWQNPWPRSAHELLTFLKMSENLPCSFLKIFAQLIPQSDGQVLSFKCLHPSFVSCAQNAAYITSKLGLKSVERLKQSGGAGRGVPLYISGVRTLPEAGSRQIQAEPTFCRGSTRHIVMQDHVSGAQRAPAASSPPLLWLICSWLVAEGTAVMTDYSDTQARCLTL